MFVLLYYTFLCCRERMLIKLMRRDVWIFLLALGVLFFTWPIMSIFKDSLAIYLFVIWLIFILLILVTTIFSQREDDGS